MKIPEVKLTLRLEKGLHDFLKKRAVAESRSLHNMIVFILKSYMTEELKKK